MRYTAWGEVRYNWGSTPTDYTYTGQYSDSYINLLWYNSRHYDPALGRFTQPDTIVPLASQGTQAWDRFAYVNNNPVKYDDPSGHDVGCGGRNASECVSPHIIFFGGSDPTSIYKPGPNPADQSRIWLTDLDGNPVNVVAYPGVQPYVGIPGKLQQAINAQGLSPDVSVNLIAYSAGTESALMYAHWRLDNNQPVDSIVLLGPTFETLAMDFDNPDGGWSAVMDDLIEQGVNIYVLDDAWETDIDIAGYQPPTCSGCGSFYKQRERLLPHYPPFPSWWQGTNNSERLKNSVYTWLTEPQ